MPQGKVISQQTKRRFFRLLEAGLPMVEAAKRTGISYSSAKRLAVGQRPGLNDGDESKKVDAKGKPPKTYDQLDSVAQHCLEDFAYFSEVVLARTVAPWRVHAAKRSIEFLLNRADRDYVVANMPPGVGKTTLWTLDIPLWLVAGGGSLDPGWGRALRFLLGHFSKAKASSYVDRMRRILTLRTPYYDKDSRRQAQHSMVDLFGRFMPDLMEGEEKIWRHDQFVVAQLADVDLYEKEPTVQAAGYESAFLGQRVDYEAWDDLVVSDTSNNPDRAERLERWFEDEAETRLEPGGVLWLVGQRFGPNDLFRSRLNVTYEDEWDRSHPLYHHIVYPAHSDHSCDGTHRQWNLESEGCLLDEGRLPWRDLLKSKVKPNFRTVYQQEESDPGTVLVLPVWLQGGEDPDGFECPGCYDYDRAFYEWPDGVDTIDYATVDPAAGEYWALEWWAVAEHGDPLPTSRPRYLIAGKRQKMSAGLDRGLLDWDPVTAQHVGVMEEWQARSELLGRPIQTWVIEANAAQRHLFQFNHFRSWRLRYPYVRVIEHTTGRNKSDQQLGVQALLPMAYRAGLKRLPYRKGSPELLHFVNQLVYELTHYPHARHSDTVMADWFGEKWLSSIVNHAASNTASEWEIDARMPEYLLNQRRIVRTA